MVPFGNSISISGGAVLVFAPSIHFITYLGDGYFQKFHPLAAQCHLFQVRRFIVPLVLMGDDIMQACELSRPARLGSPP